MKVWDDKEDNSSMVALLEITRMRFFVSLVGNKAATFGISKNRNVYTNAFNASVPRHSSLNGPKL